MDLGYTADLCIKCNICTTACPVSAVTNLFPGPKAVGPQAERFRHPANPVGEEALQWCSGCRTCSRVCPHGVAVAEMILQVRSKPGMMSRSRLRDHVLSRPALIGRFSAPISRWVNAGLKINVVRWLVEKIFGVSRHAPLPEIDRQPLRNRYPDLLESLPPHGNGSAVAYFHGCSSNYYEPEIGEKTIAVLQRVGCEVYLPPQDCCGLPLQSNGFFKAAHRYALSNIHSLQPWVEQGVPIVGSSTSCIFALKHDYANVLGIQEPGADSVGAGTYDLFEYLLFHKWEEILELEFEPLEVTALYHPPCQLKSHGIGTPAATVLSNIPDLTLMHSYVECCGAAGTYGLKRENYDIARDVGEDLFEQARMRNADFVLSDSESCRWWIHAHTGLPAYHPIEIIAHALGLSPLP